MLQFACLAVLTVWFYYIVCKKNFWPWGHNFQAWGHKLAFLAIYQPCHTPFKQKKQKQIFEKKVDLQISGVKKRRLSASKKVDLRILGAKKSRFNHQKIELKIFNALKGLVQCIQHYIYHNNCIISKGVRLYADLGINFHNFFVFWIWMMKFGTERTNGCF